MMFINIRLFQNPAAHHAAGNPEIGRRPCGIFYEQDLELESNHNKPEQEGATQNAGIVPIRNHRESKSVDYSFENNNSHDESSKLTVRALTSLPGSTVVENNLQSDDHFEERAIDVPENGYILTTRSCENFMKMKDTKSDNDLFRVPQLPLSSMPKSASTKSKLNLLSYKLSPKVFGLSRPSISYENLASGSSSKRGLFGERVARNLSEDVEKSAIEESMEGEYIDIWGSLQEVNGVEAVLRESQDDLTRSCFLEGATSEPNLVS